MDSSLTLKPIGYLRTGQRLKFHAGHQPSAARDEASVIELLPQSGFREALQDLNGFSHIWLLWWFHRNEGWRPQVLPPRGPAQRRGVFATRSPHRPNPLGLTPVPLLGIDGLRLHIGPCDLVDGTPIFDLKPYVPAFDAFPEARAGWIDAVEAAMTAPAPYRVRLLPLAETQARWLRDTWQIDFLPRLEELLSRDPTPHRTRRIRKHPVFGFEIGCGSWRAYFRLEGEEVLVAALGPSYPLSFLTREGYENIPDREAQMAFLSQWAQVERGHCTPPPQEESDPGAPA